MSIIVPIYNSSTYLLECLNSINETTKNIPSEILSMDDGSTYSLASAYVNNHPKFKLFKLKHVGVAKASNLATTLVKGKYLAFVDSDDIVEPTIYEKLIKAIEKDQSDIAFCKIKRFPDKNKPYDFLDKSFINLNEDPTHIRKHPELVFDCLIPNEVINTSFYKQHNFQYSDASRFQDMTIGFALHYEANQVSFVNKYLYLYRTNLNSLSHKLETLPLFYEHMNMI